MSQKDRIKPPVQTLAGHVFGGDKSMMIDARMAYIKIHGCRFLFHNEPPSVPGYPRAGRKRMER